MVVRSVQVKSKHRPGSIGPASVDQRSGSSLSVTYFVNPRVHHLHRMYVSTAMGFTARKQWQYSSQGRTISHTQFTFFSSAGGRRMLIVRLGRYQQFQSYCGSCSVTKVAGIQSREAGHTRTSKGSTSPLEWRWY